MNLHYIFAVVIRAYHKADKVSPAMWLLPGTSLNYCITHDKIWIPFDVTYKEKN